MAKPSNVTDVICENSTIRQDITVVGLPGHYFEMTGLDIYDIAQYKDTIVKIKELHADYYVLSHREILENIQNTADHNLEAVGV